MPRRVTALAEDLISASLSVSEYIVQPALKRHFPDSYLTWTRERQAMLLYQRGFVERIVRIGATEDGTRSGGRRRWISG